MTDEIDTANEHVTKMEEQGILAIRRAAASIPVGEPGDCDGCGEYFTRLVGGFCGRCRDKQERSKGRRL